MVRLVILVLTGPFIEFDCSRYRCSSERVFVTSKYKENLRDFQQSEPSMVFDPSEFEAPKFDCSSVRT